MSLIVVVVISKQKKGMANSRSLLSFYGIIPICGFRGGRFVQSVFFHFNVEGGERMSLILSLLEIIVKAIVKTSVSALAKFAVSRIKERIAPIGSRNDSENNRNK